jgi:hypothetical protein
VEDKISKDVSTYAEKGDFDGQVYVHTPDWVRDFNEFRKATGLCLENLGYKVLDYDIRAGGTAYTISWEDAN